MARQWTQADMPSQEGRVALVTGANSGLGYQTAKALAAAGARVLLAGRNPAKVREARDRIVAADPGAAIEEVHLDLADLASVRLAAAEVGERHERLDLLVNNAGVMATPPRTTVDGFELQFGTNHLGHFALTGLLLDRVLAAPAARVVTVSSGVHQFGRMDFDDLQSRRRYQRWRAYGQSKLANLLFAYELQRRLARRGAPAVSVAAHPGYAATNLQLAGPRMAGSKLGETLSKVANRLFAQSDEMGALPLLYAATAPDIRGGEYVGPNGFSGSRGFPAVGRSSAASHDEAAAARLWETSESLTGVRYDDALV